MGMLGDMDTNANSPTAKHGRPTGTRRSTGRWLVPLAAVGCCLATPVVTWWLVGVLIPERPAAGVDSYFLRTLVPSALEQGIGLGAALVALTTVIVLAWTSRQRQFDQRWWGTIGPMLGVGVIAGIGLRVLTMPSVGANIGAGLFLLFGTPLVVLVVLWCLAWSTFLGVSARRSAVKRPETSSPPDAGSQD